MALSYIPPDLDEPAGGPRAEHHAALLPELRAILDTVVEAFLDNEPDPNPDDPRRYVNAVSEHCQNLDVALHRAITQLEALRHHNLVKIVDTAIDTLEETITQDNVIRSAAHEIALRTASSPHGLQWRMSTAWELIHVQPRVQRGLERGDFSLQHAREILRFTDRLSGEALEQYLDTALELAQRMSPVRLRQKLRLLLATLNPESVDAQKREAFEQRCVRVNTFDDGSAQLVIDGPAPLIVAISDRVRQIAERVIQLDRESSCPETEAAPEPFTPARASDATLMQREADVAIELLLSGNLGVADPKHPEASIGARVTGQVRVTVPMHALANPGHGDTDGENTRGAAPFRANFAELDGYGPIDLDSARQLAAVAPSWDILRVERFRGVLSSEKYRPTAQLRQHVAARDQHCRFPFCSKPPHRCEIDHTLGWAEGGATDSDNLSLLCKAHHTLKHPDLDRILRWKVIRMKNGDQMWISPTGNKYLSEIDTHATAFSVVGAESAEPAPVDVPWGAPLPAGH